MSWDNREGAGSSSALRGSEVLIDVVPFGKTPESVFREYAELVSKQCERIELTGTILVI